MSGFDAALDVILGIEGDEFTDDPVDSGGPTKYGITEFAARQWGYTGDMRDFPASSVRPFYRDTYWLAMRLDQVDILSPRIAAEMLEAGINCGNGRAVEWIQRALNVLNLGGRYYSDLVVDGGMGERTLGALEIFLRVRGDEGEAVLLTAQNCLQGAFYIQLAERRAKDERFVYGWLKERVLLA